MNPSPAAIRLATLAHGLRHSFIASRMCRAKSREQSRDEVETTTMPYLVYILRTSSNTLYIGQTNNLEKRIQEHKNKSSKSAKYIRYFSSFDLVYTESYSTRKEAMQREAQLKKWSRKKKDALIHGRKNIIKEAIVSSVIEKL